MFLKWIRALVKYRWVTLAVIALSTLLAGRAARGIQFRFQYRDFFDYPSNPQLPVFSRYTDEFGDPGGYVVMLLRAPDVFQPEVLRYLSDVTRKLETYSEFSEVRSLTNAPCIRAVGGDVESGPLVERLPTTRAEAEPVRRSALGSALLVRRVVSADGTASAVLAQMRTPAALASIEEERKAVDLVQGVVREHAPPLGAEVVVTGAPRVEVDASTSLAHDQATFMPAVFLVIVLVLALTFRSVSGVLLPLTAVVVSLVWTAGIFGALHRSIDIVGSSFPTILVVYGVVDPIFVYTRYLDKLEVGRPPRDAICEALSELAAPCFLTSFTTALGFAAFMTATLPTIRNFGLVVAIGVSLSFLTTLTVLPALAAIVPTPRRRRATHASGSLEAALGRLWHEIRFRRTLVLLTALTALALGIVAFRQLPIVNEYTGILPEGPAKAGVRALERSLSGVVRLVVYLEGPEGSMKRPEVLKAIEAVDRMAEREPEVDSSISAADLVGEANQAFEGGDPRFRKVPDSASLVAQYLALTDPADRADFITDDYAKSHIRILITDRGSLAVRRLRGALEREVEARLAPLGIRASITGKSVLAYEEADRVVVEVLWGFVVAFTIIVLLEWAMFRSLRVALISVLPNLVPVAASFLAMRGAGLHLRIDNALILCISVGGLFNTTIHMIARILRQIREGETDPDLIVERALRIVGPPALYTALVLSIGFSVLALSRFPGLRALGLLTMVTLLVGFVSDAVVTSTLMRSAFGWKKAFSEASSLGRVSLPPVDIAAGER